ncbi:TetR/AcrR family transcriptional regulator [Paraburkholderia sediminicola]|uniref:TetR/AcrR family transcriptional regulator n=1 Tax=Paraburkholderia sediminicola TaxID=458836 RepID=UPI0038BB7829
MVDTIIDAAIRVLATRGWVDFTTNEVAAVAGVSVGSLYQYFADKLALAEMIRQRHLGSVLDALSIAGEGSEPETLDERVVCLIDGVIAVHSVNHVLHRILLNEVPLASRSNSSDFEREYQRRYRAVIESSSKTRDKARDDMAGRVLAAAVEGVVHAAARSAELDSPILKEELIKLVCGYLHNRPSEKFASKMPLQSN